MTDLRKMSDEELVQDIWNMAGFKENELVEERAEILRRLAGAAPSEGMKPEPEIDWKGLYQRTEDALLALRVELGGKDYKTHAIDHVAAIRYLLKEGAALSPAQSGEQKDAVADQYGFGTTPERAAPRPVSGDAPKVKEVPLARKAAYALVYADAVTVDEMEAILRPYFSK